MKIISRSAVLYSRENTKNIYGTLTDEYNEETIQAAQNLQALMDEMYMIRDLQNTVPEWLLDYLVYGTGVMKVRFNEELLHIYLLKE